MALQSDALGHHSGAIHATPTTHPTDADLLTVLIPGERRLLSARKLGRIFEVTSKRQHPKLWKRFIALPGVFTKPGPNRQTWVAGSPDLLTGGTQQTTRGTGHKDGGRGTGAPGTSPPKGGEGAPTSAPTSAPTPRSVSSPAGEPKKHYAAGSTYKRGPYTYEKCVCGRWEPQGFSHACGPHPPGSDNPARYQHPQTVDYFLQRRRTDQANGRARNLDNEENIARLARLGTPFPNFDDKDPDRTEARKDREAREQEINRRLSNDSTPTTDDRAEAEDGPTFRDLHRQAHVLPNEYKPEPEEPEEKPAPPDPDPGPPW